MSTLQEKRMLTKPRGSTCCRNGQSPLYPRESSAAVCRRRGSRVPTSKILASESGVLAFLEIARDR